MRPIPKPIMDMFFPGVPVEGRPWWIPCLKGQIRRDGVKTRGAASFDAGLSISVGVGMDGELVYPPQEIICDDPVMYDRGRPLSHPGFRPGQMWAKERDGIVTTYRITDARPRWVDIGKESERSVQAFEFDSRSTPRTEEELMGWLIGCFLIADLTCPHLAPWAPPEQP